MRTVRWAGLGWLVAITACATPASRANDLCEGLVRAQVAERCEVQDRPQGDDATVRFELTEGGSHGFVYAFVTDEGFRTHLESYEATDELFAAHGMRPHVVSNADTRVVVMLVSTATEEAQAEAARLVAE